VKTERLEDGRLAIMTAQGWRLATPQEEAATDTGRGQAWAAQGVRNMLNLNDLMGQYNPLARMGSPEGYQPQLDRAAENMASREQQFSALDQAQPGASQAGGLYGDPMNAAGLGVGAYRFGQGMMARRVMQAGTRQASQAAAAAGNSSVGAAAVGDDVARQGLAREQSLIRRMVRAPRQLYDDISQAADEFLSPGSLTPDQTQMLPVADELGFRFFPGQRDGAAGLRIMAESDPLIQAAFAGDMQANRQGLRAAAAKAIGINADDFSRDFLGRAADDLGSVFDDIGGQIGRQPLPEELLTQIEQIRATEPFLNIGAQGSLSGRELMSLRSSLDAASRQAWLQGAQAPAGKAQFIDDVVQQLDDIAEGALSSEQQQAWRVARERWRNLKVLESPNVVSPTGEINARSLDTRLQKYYKGAYQRQVTGTAGRRAGLTPETQQFMDWSRLGTQFADNFPNSGTAYRNRLIQLMTDPKELAKSVVLRQMIETRLATGANP
jgi:hypothetical protein